MQTTDVYKVVVNASGQNVSYDICSVCVCVCARGCVGECVFFFLLISVVLVERKAG